jgi:predicted O-methyltransferase YrrM
MPYPYAVEIPELVKRAHSRAEAIGFPLMPAGRPIGQPAPTTAVTPMDGALLRCLAAGHPGGVPGGVIGEIGTGPGVTSWLLSGLGRGARLISCEIDPELAAGAAEFFAGWPQVEIRSGDWRRVLSSEPFDLLFFDADAQTLLGQRESWPRLLAPAQDRRFGRHGRSGACRNVAVRMGRHDGSQTRVLSLQPTGRRRGSADIANNGLDHCNEA